MSLINEKNINEIIFKIPILKDLNKLIIDSIDETNIKHEREKFFTNYKKSINKIDNSQRLKNISSACKLRSMKMRKKLPIVQTYRLALPRGGSQSGAERREHGGHGNAAVGCACGGCLSVAWAGGTTYVHVRTVPSAATRTQQGSKGKIP